jgi:hypothetical protein
VQSATPTATQVPCRTTPLVPRAFRRHRGTTDVSSRCSWPREVRPIRPDAAPPTAGRVGRRKFRSRAIQKGDLGARIDALQILAAVARCQDHAGALTGQALPRESRTCIWLLDTRAFRRDLHSGSNPVIHEHCLYGSIVARCRPCSPARRRSMAGDGVSVQSAEVATTRTRAGVPMASASCQIVPFAACPFAAAGQSQSRSGANQAAPSRGLKTAQIAATSTR